MCLEEVVFFADFVPLVVQVLELGLQLLQRLIKLTLLIPQPVNMNFQIAYYLFNFSCALACLDQGGLPLRYVAGESADFNLLVLNLLLRIFYLRF